MNEQARRNHTVMLETLERLNRMPGIIYTTVGGDAGRRLSLMATGAYDAVTVAMREIVKTPDYDGLPICHCGSPAYVSELCPRCLSEVEAQDDARMERNDRHDDREVVTYE